VVRSQLLLRQWSLYERHEYDTAFDETHALLAKLQGDDLLDAQRLLGLCLYRKGDYSQASAWFRKNCAGRQESHDWFLLALAYTRQGDSEAGAEAFEQARLCQQISRFCQFPGYYQQLFSYAWVLCEAARDGKAPQLCARVQALLDQLALAYRRLHRTEPAFLQHHAIPFLASTLDLATRYFRTANRYAEGVVWLQNLGEALDESGQRQVSKAMEELRGV